MATGYSLDGRGIGVRLPAGKGGSFLLHSVQTDSGAQPTCTMGTGRLFSAGKADGA
jgi:hypothetical protein